MLDDTTLREVFHFRVSLLGAVSVITISIIALIVLLSVLIVYTPIRNILPGSKPSRPEISSPIACRVWIRCSV